MKNLRPFIQIRSRKLGLLIYDSRQHARRSMDECAAAIGVSPEEYRTFESGSAAPSLPQIELLSIYLNVPLDHFWSKQALSTTARPPHAEQGDQLLVLRNRVIGASLRLARNNKNISLADLSAQTEISPEQLERYEKGDVAVPLPELEILATILETPVATFYDQHGPIGKWRAQQSTNQVGLDLTPEMQSFVSKPVNRPYLDIALKLSEMPVEKLRVLAESLLEITY
jgi:transcriptional regulator with XRE-family HTH domain